MTYFCKYYHYCLFAANVFVDSFFFFPQKLVFIFFLNFYHFKNLSLLLQGGACVFWITVLFSRIFVCHIHIPESNFFFHLLMCKHRHQQKDMHGITWKRTQAYIVLIAFTHANLHFWSFNILHAHSFYGKVVKGRG